MGIYKFCHAKFWHVFAKFIRVIKERAVMLDKVSTGLPGVDEVINGLRLGDNVVWQVTDIEDYIKFARPFVKRSLEDGNRVVYVRFAQHKPVIPYQDGAVIYKVDAYSGFESFSTQIYQIITKEGRGVFYVFDCLSDLLSAWATDLMIGNFFVITCPYLFELNTVAYFAILKNGSSYQTVARIRETTQVLLDVYNNEGNTYLHPLKVWNRYTPTMFLPHVEKDGRFIPITNSGEAAKLFAEVAHQQAQDVRRYLDYWDRLFLRAAELCERSKTGSPPSQQEVHDMLEVLLKILIGRDERILALARQAFTLEDMLYIKSRLIGSGFIGGKAVGMLLARKILQQDNEMDWQKYLEHHDSFYIGSDVFYTYIVQNGLWKVRMEQKSREKYFEAAKQLREGMLKGAFPENIREQFLRMLEYFGQSPIIVRSSSLLEDGFGNAFAGKYESIFCINQGSLEQRYYEFEEAVRRIFASTVNEDALTYRLQRGLDQQDEQMALLVQRVSGAYHKYYFFPDVAGVGFSVNPYVWKDSMDPKAGMLRLVCGLGTRAVNRVEGDYARIVALDACMLQPIAGKEDIRQFSQHKMDVLNIRENCLQSCPLEKLLEEKVNMSLDMVADRDYEAEKRLRELGLTEKQSWIITFNGLLSGTSFPCVMQKMLKAIEKRYHYPVDVEFTVNFDKEGDYRINVLQCRPLQVKGIGGKVGIPHNIEADRVFFQTKGNFMGGNIRRSIRRIILVEPQAYVGLNEQEKYRVARIVGKLNRMISSNEETPVALIGPGRWGTSTPFLGIPVTFSEIHNVAVLVEVAYTGTGYMPDLSFGTHFFQDIVESDIFYVALFPEREGVVFNKELLDGLKNILPEALPDDASFRDVIKVYDVDEHIYGKLEIIADVVDQRVICMFSS